VLQRSIVIATLVSSLVSATWGYVQDILRFHAVYCLPCSCPRGSTPKAVFGHGFLTEVGSELFFSPKNSSQHAKSGCDFLSRSLPPTLTVLFPNLTLLSFLLLRLPGIVEPGRSEDGQVPGQHAGPGGARVALRARTRCAASSSRRLSSGGGSLRTRGSPTLSTPTWPTPSVRWRAYHSSLMQYCTRHFSTLHPEHDSQTSVPSLISSALHSRCARQSSSLPAFMHSRKAWPTRAEERGENRAGQAQRGRGG